MKLRIVLLQLEAGSVCAPMLGNAQAIEDHTCSVRPVERIEVDTRDIIFEKILTLFQRVLNSCVSDHFGIILATV